MNDAATPTQAQPRVDASRGSALLDLFAGGPPMVIRRVCRFPSPEGANVSRRIVAIVAVGWAVPLGLLVVRAILGEGDALHSFVSDFAVHNRSLIAAPVLILAEALTSPRLGAMAGHFLDAGLVPSSERPGFEAAVRSTQRLRDARLAELGVALIAYGTLLALISSSLTDLPAWQRPDGATSSLFSLAGWWHALVSIPILLSLVFGWIWRVVLWARFLWLVAKLNLRLIPAHPDHAAGLRFVGHSMRAFSTVGFAFGAIVAGTLANHVVHKGASPLICKNAAIALGAFVVVLFGTPLLMFTRNLLVAWRRGVLQYGGLADRLGREFEAKWFGKEDPGQTLDVPDFSSAVDLYSVVAAVYEIRFIPIDFPSVAILVVATLLPLGPVLLMALPFDVILDALANLLF